MKLNPIKLKVSVKLACNLFFFQSKLIFTSANTYTFKSNPIFYSFVLVFDHVNILHFNYPLFY